MQTGDYKIATIQILDHLWPFMQKKPKRGIISAQWRQKGTKVGIFKKLSKNRQIKSSQVICDPKSQLFMSQFLNFQSETKIVKITHSGMGTLMAIFEHQKMVWRQVEQGFSSFSAKFLSCLMIFQSFTALYFEKSSNMTKIWQKNEEKPCSTHFSTGPKPGFRVRSRSATK